VSANDNLRSTARNGAVVLVTTGAAQFERVTGGRRRICPSHARLRQEHARTANHAGTPAFRKPTRHEGPRLRVRGVAYLYLEKMTTRLALTPFASTRKARRFSREATCGKQWIPRVSNRASLMLPPHMKAAHNHRWLD